MLDPSLMDLLRRMQESDLEFIVIGGVAAILQGAPVTTRDLDIVYRKSPENVDRLVGVLEASNARLNDLAGRILRPSRELLSRGRQILLVTDDGPLDCLGELMDGRGYDDLMPHTDEYSDGRTLLRILNLQTLIETKLAVGRPKDRLVVPVLLAVLRARQGD